MATPRPSTHLWLARAGLTAGSAFGLVRVFDPGRWLAAVLLAAVLPHALAEIAGRRRWSGLATITAMAAAGLVFTALVVEPHTTAFGIPSLTTFSTWWTDLVEAPDVLRRAVVPVVPAGAPLLLAVVAVWVAGAATEWAARRLDAPLGTVAPSLVLYVAIAALGEGAWVAVTIVYTAAIAVYLLVSEQAQHRERRNWFYATKPRRSNVLRGGVAAAGALVLGAAIAGPLLPGARSDAWFDYRELGDGDGSRLLELTTPLIGVQSKLLVDPQRELFEVRAERPAYWRVGALEEYDGELWGLTDTSDEAGDIAAPPERTDGYVLEQEYSVRDADPNWLPAAYHPIGEVEGVDGVRYVEGTATLYVETDGRLSSLRYTVRSAIPTPGEDQLRAAPFVDPAAFQKTLALPGGFPERVAALAESIAAGAAGPYERAVALERFFTITGGFEYQLQIDDEDDRLHDIETMEDFLFDVKAGYCEQFASSFAAMARYLGLPARVAVGYTPGEPQGDGTWLVRNENAHAWPEVYFTGIGWVPFEPTPGRFEPTTGRGTGTPPPDQPTATSSTSSTSTTRRDGAATPSTLRPLDPDRNVNAGAPQESSDSSSPLRDVLTFVALALAALAVGAAGAIAILAFAAARRTHRRRHAHAPRDRVIGAWSEALEHLAVAGVRRRPSATPVEFALRHAPAHGAGEAGPALMDLAQMQTAALFGREEPTAEEATRAWDRVDVIGRSLRRSTPWLTRWRRRLDPRGRDTAVA